MQLPLHINQSEYSLIQYYLRLDIESIKFDGLRLSDDEIKSYQSLHKKINSIAFDLFD